MSGSYGVQMARISGDRKPRVNLCGDCGIEVAETELLCDECTNLEPVTEQARRRV